MNIRPAPLLSGNLELNRGQVRKRSGLKHTLSKWIVRFGGSEKDLAVDEFLVAADNVNADSLRLGLHCLLTGDTSDWVQRRKFPTHTCGLCLKGL